MGKLIVIAGIALCVVALVLFLIYIVLAGNTSKRLKKQLEKEYQGE